MEREAKKDEKGGEEKGMETRLEGHVSDEAARQRERAGAEPREKTSLNAELAEGGGPPAGYCRGFHGDGDALGRRGNTVPGEEEGLGGFCPSQALSSPLPQAGDSGPRTWRWECSLPRPSSKDPADVKDLGAPSPTPPHPWHLTLLPSPGSWRVLEGPEEC